MKRLLFLPLFAASQALVLPSYAADNDPPPADTAPIVRELAAFKTFFKKKGGISEDEVTAQFGPPDSHVPLYSGQKEPPSRWYYNVENGERVGVAIEDHRVILVTRHHRNKSIDVIRERSSLVKP